ncbi:hypothetical protein BDQ12DRAFT_683413 [Crucibulum laeve]|uniref:BTB domain-containing protein n=1 Tax=Crucibulum laeve TaxID=68775 RepID=A0A5C3M214_9AGAR|nr:hypothetical protein BDQ12DRAFT_683413 [Crucibulum laeve]
MDTLFNSVIRWDDQSPTRANFMNGYIQEHNDSQGISRHSPFPPHFLPMTPSDSEASEDSDEGTSVSVSSVFYPGSHQASSDIVFRSTDSVLFYVRSNILFKTAKTAFREILSSHLIGVRPMQNIVDIPETSDVLNIILHMLHNTSSARHSPSIATLEAAVDRMPAYGITPKSHIVPSTPLYHLLLSQAPLFPMKIYALAARHDLYDLAVNGSSHLLSQDLSEITDTLAQQLGAVYLKRLMTLHMERIESLRRILIQPPHPHAPTKECNFDDQKNLTRAWALVAAYLAWDARPDLSIHHIQTTFNSLNERLDCELCHDCLSVRIKDVIAQWASVKRTI